MSFKKSAEPAPPNDICSNGHFIASAKCLAIVVLPTPGGPTNAKTSFHIWIRQLKFKIIIIVLSHISFHIIPYLTI